MIELTVALLLLKVLNVYLRKNAFVYNVS